MRPAVPSAPGPRHALSEAARYRWGVASRTVAAVAGGYVLAALAAAVMARHLPMVRPDAVIAGTLTALVVFPCAVLWCFAASTARRAWAGVALPALLLGLPVLVAEVVR